MDLVKLRKNIKEYISHDDELNCRIGIDYSMDNEYEDDIELTISVYHEEYDLTRPRPSGLKSNPNSDYQLFFNFGLTDESCNFLVKVNFERKIELNSADLYLINAIRGEVLQLSNKEN